MEQLFSAVVVFVWNKKSSNLAEAYQHSGVNCRLCLQDRRINSAEENTAGYSRKGEVSAETAQVGID
jgi:hypothetical protein